MNPDISILVAEERLAAAQRKLARAEQDREQAARVVRAAELVLQHAREKAGRGENPD